MGRNNGRIIRHVRCRVDKGAKDQAFGAIDVGRNILEGGTTVKCGDTALG